MCRQRDRLRGVEHIPWLYDAGMRLIEATGLGRWRAWLVGGARGLTLDLGLGTGRDLPLFAGGARPIGLDPDHRALRRARRRGPGVPLVVARAEALPFRTGTFDTVLSSLVFCSVDDPERGLREVRRVLKPDGRLRMLEHVRATHPVVARLQDAAQPAWTWLTGGCRPNRETEATVRAAGFRIVPESRRAKRTMRRFEARREEEP